MKNLGAISKGFKISVGRRDGSGQILVRGRSRGRFFLYRFVDVSNILCYNLDYRIVDYLFDRFRRNYINIVFYMNGIISYKLSINGVGLGKIVRSGLSSVLLEKYDLGTCFRIENLKEGSVINQLNIGTNFKSSFLRAPGMSGTLVKVDFERKVGLVKFINGTKKLTSLLNLCILGTIGNRFYYDTKLAKAGLSRTQGRRPKVRGIAMNPVDHPNGGRTPGGKVYRSKYNNIARSKKKTAANISFIYPL